MSIRRDVLNEPAAANRLPAAAVVPSCLFQPSTEHYYQRETPPIGDAATSFPQRRITPTYGPMNRAQPPSRILQYNGGNWRLSEPYRWDDSRLAALNTPKHKKRLTFMRTGCLVFGYPSSGGILVMHPTLVDLQYLCLSRFEPCHSSSVVKDEDEFCSRMRRIGADWWSSEKNWAEAEFGLREKTAKEKEKLVFGWPEDGTGVWVLRFLAPDDIPRDFGRLDFAMNMSEKVQIMRSFGAEYVEGARMAEFGISPRASNASTRGGASGPQSKDEVST
ncbi:hypothetical protein LTR95_011886 [Oleoguttula sp. CCFEE 5521]